MKSQKKEEMKMSYEEFTESVIKELRQRPLLNFDDIACASIPANNNVYRQGIQLTPKRKSKSAADKKIFVNLQDFYEDYRLGIPMETILGMIAQHITDICEDGFHTLLQEKSYEWAKGHLLVEVCNEEMNRRQLLHMPHEVKGNLALRYYLWIDHRRRRNTVLVNNALLAQWGISEETLRKDAWENMKKELPPIVCSLNELLAEVLGKGSMEIENISTEDDFLHVISNTVKLHGASYMFDEELMDDLAEQFNDDLVILPSSVHEVLFLRKKDAKNMDELLRTVVEVNSSMVPPEEVLSNSVYVYDRETHKISTFK